MPCPLGDPLRRRPRVPHITETIVASDPIGEASATSRGVRRSDQAMEEL
jgi:hypothetical protein